MESWTVGKYKLLATHAAPSDPLYKYLRACDKGSFEGEAETAGNVNPNSLVNLFSTNEKNEYDFVL